MARQRVSQTELARALGMTQPGVSRRIRGDVSWSADELIRVAATLGVPVAELYVGVEPVEPNGGDERGVA